MLELINVLPSESLIEEVSFNLTAAASRDGVTIDGRDWYGSAQADFTENRKFGFPLLDLAIRPPGNVNVIVQSAVPTFPIAEPPVLTWTNHHTLAVAAATWGSFLGLRLAARFNRIRVTDTSGAPNNGIYMIYFVRGF